MTVWYEEDSNELVSSNGPQEFRLRLDAHERSALEDIVDQFGEAASVSEGDRVIFVDTDGEEHPGIVTKAWDANTLNIAYVTSDGDFNEETSVTGETPESTGCYWFEGGDD